MEREITYEGASTAGPKGLTAGPILRNPHAWNNKGLERQARILFWSAVLVLGFLQAWSKRHAMNVDGISYLDMSDAYLHRGWTGLVNGYWSPFYPWLLAVARILLPGSGYWEFAILHLVNLLAFLGAAAALEFLIGEMLAQKAATGRGSVPLPSSTFRAIGYLTFLWLSLTLITLGRESPDMLMSIFVYLGTGCILRMRRNADGWVGPMLLGGALGLGYLAKTPMFPLAFIFLGTAFFAASSRKKAAPRVLLAFTVFTLVAAPLVTALSREKGRFTFGDSGRWNYMTEIDGAGPIWYNMQDVGNARGKFIHPPQKIHDAPAVYSLDGPVGGTLPTWYDPSYWIEGATPRLALRRQAVMFLTNSGDCFDLIFSQQAALLVVFVAVCCLGAGATFRRLLGEWPVWVPAIAGLGGYLIVVVQPRYTAAFLTVLWLALFSAVRLRSEGDSWKIQAGAVIALMVALGAPMLLSGAKNFDGGVLHRHEHVRWETAVQLHRMGVHPGDRVGWIGDLHDVESARLLHLRIVGEVPRFQATDFWTSNTVVQSQVIDSFGKIGAKAIIAEQVPPTEVFPPALSWKQVGDSDFWVHVMEPAAQASK